MAVTTSVNNRSVVHKNSGGVTMTFPDTCKTPAPGGPVPIPYPNVAKSADTAQGSTTVKVDGQPIAVEGSSFSQSTGDEAGSAGGVVSSTTRGKAEFINYSLDVKVDGKAVARQLDPMISNKGSAGNTPPAPELQAPIVVLLRPPQIDEEHLLFCRLAYKHPDVVTGDEVVPRCSAGHELRGPTRKDAPPSKTPYSRIFDPRVSAGSHDLELSDFDVKPRPYLPKT